VSALLLDLLRLEAGLGQGLGDLLLQRVVDLGATNGGDLHGGILRIDVGQRVQRADQHHDQDDDVFPAGIFEHDEHRVRS
jgi:hypothetical protein